MPLPAVAAPALLAPPRTMIEPLTANLRRIHVTVSKRFMEKLEAARDALSHSHPGADAEAILEAGLDLLIERAAKRKGCTRPKAEKGPRPTGSSLEVPKTAPSPGLSPAAGERGDARGIPPDVAERGDARRSPRYIAAHVKREVWLRDAGRCQFRLENGEACGATHRLQFDHIRPVALGGRSAASNIRLACAPHNLLAARRVFGDALMDRYARARAAGALSEAR